MTRKELALSDWRDVDHNKWYAHLPALEKAMIKFQIWSRVCPVAATFTLKQEKESLKKGLRARLMERFGNLDGKPMNEVPQAEIQEAVVEFLKEDERQLEELLMKGAGYL